MIAPAHDLAITKQAKALNISRGSVYTELLGNRCVPPMRAERRVKSGVSARAIGHSL